MVPRNQEEPTLSIVHFQLDPADEKANHWASKCPQCKEGRLPVRRHRSSNQIAKNDICLLCGQRVVYIDIEDMRRKDKPLEKRREKKK